MNSAQDSSAASDQAAEPQPLPTLPSRDGNVQLSAVSPAPGPDSMLLAPEMAPSAVGEPTALLGPANVASSEPVQPPAFAPASAPATSYDASITQRLQLGVTDGASDSNQCGKGCITGAVLGGVFGGALLLAVIALICMCCRRRRQRSKNLSELDFLDNAAAMSSTSSSMTGHQLCQQYFGPGDRVFCQMGHTCATGSVVAPGGNKSYHVQLADGTRSLFQNSQMAPNLVADASVYYQNPKGGPQISCTVLHADGSYWPPFYHLRPDDSSLDSINTTAEHVVTNGKFYEVYSNEIIAHAA